MNWVRFELNSDNFIKNKENIYRITLNGEFKGKKVLGTSSPTGVGPEALATCPEVKNYLRLIDQKQTSLRVDNTKLFREDGFAADSAFFTFFPYIFKLGNPQNCLSHPNSIVITNELAQKCFGNENPLGKIIKLDFWELTVTGVIEDLPSNSHLKFRFIYPTSRLGEWFEREKWAGDQAFTYLLLYPKAKIADLNKKITDMVFAKNGFWKSMKIQFLLEPMCNIYLNSDITQDYANRRSKTSLYTLLVVALLILFIACINFTNLYISYSLKNSKTLAIQQVNGASKNSIISGLLIEVLFYVAGAYLLALMLSNFLLPLFNSLIGSNMPYRDIGISWIGVITFFTAFVFAGFFPVAYLSKKDPVKSLKDISNKGNSKSTIQKVLVIAQFMITIVLLTGVFVIMKQVYFMKSKNLGFEKENVAFTYLNGKLKDKDQLNVLKHELSKNPNIVGVAYLGGIATKWNNGMPLSVHPQNNDFIECELIEADDDYFSLMKIRFREGSNGLDQYSDSLNYCIINQKVVDKLGLKPPYIGQLIYDPWSPRPYTIKGVIENINNKPLRMEVDANIYLSHKWLRGEGILLFKLRNNVQNGLEAIQEYWTKIAPDYPFEYRFLNDLYNRLYEPERKLQLTIILFAFLAIILTCLGLLALVYYNTNQRTKEIGIRKVNGARVSEILAMLNKDFVKWVAIAFVIATPIAWYAMHKWLENFAYKTELSWWIFALAGFLALGIALLTVSWQSWRAATRNPVEALRYE